jgi:hypothetical protein
MMASSTTIRSANEPIIKSSRSSKSNTQSAANYASN